MNSKLIVHGRWLLTDELKWRLTIDPYVDVYKSEGAKLTLVSSFLLADLDRISETPKSLGLTIVDLDLVGKHMSLTHLGDLRMPDASGYSYDMYLLLAPTEINAKEEHISGIFVDTINLEPDDEPLDIELVNKLKALKNPSSIVCTLADYGVPYAPTV